MRKNRSLAATCAPGKEQNKRGEQTLGQLLYISRVHGATPVAWKLKKTDKL